MVRVPHVTEIDWSGTRPASALDDATAATRALLLRAIDARLAAMPATVPVTTMQPDLMTAEVVAIGTTAMLATDDAGAATALQHVLARVVDLHEQAQTARALTAASLALQHRQHRRAAAEQEARHGG